MDDSTLRYLEASCKLFNVTTERALAVTVKRNKGHHANDTQLRHKDKPTANARMIAWWLIREREKLSYPQIAKQFRCSHSTIILACKKVEANDELKQVATELMKELD